LKVGIVNVLAKSKSTGKIGYGLYTWLKEQGHEVTLYYGRKDDLVGPNESDIVRVGGDLNNYYHGLCSRVFGNQGEYSVIATKKMVQDMKMKGIEAVYLLNIHGYYLNLPILFKYLSQNDIKVIYMMLDEYPFLGKCGGSLDCERFKTDCKHCPQVHMYPKSYFVDRAHHTLMIKKHAYDSIQDLTFVGIKYTVNRAKSSFLLKNAKFEEMDEAVDLRNLYFPRDVQSKRAEFGIPVNNAIILTVAPYSNPSKGGNYFMEAANKLKDRTDLSFIYVAYDGPKENVPPNVIALPYIFDQSYLADLYSLADVYVCTSLQETISNTCLEAMGCGTPLISFNTCGMPDCADEEHGHFVEAKDVDGLVKEFSKVTKKDDNRINSCREYALSRFDSIEYFKKLESLLNK